MSTMLLQSILLSAVTLSTTILAAPPNTKGHLKPPAFFLAGDSTTAIQASNGGGWGTGFLTTALLPSTSSASQNFGHNGATTSSFRSDGDWASVLSAASTSNNAYITLQFGHNDQKPAKNISMPQFTSNLITFVTEARALNATPILLTSLSRRRFSNSTGKINENLADVTAATKDAARITGAYVLDLNAASTRYLNAIGPEKAATYNLIPEDYTHLNTQGSVLFGNMVAMLMAEEVPGLRGFVKPVREVERAIRRGEYWFPESCEGEFCG